ncbi:MAG: sensor histidine kinase [Clostridia bacterium]|nr:sensor histidine kinase [Clostridia bacterium]
MAGYDEVFVEIAYILMNCVQTWLVLFMYSMVVNKIKFRFEFLLYSLLLGALTRTVGLLSKALLAPADMMVSTGLTMIIYFFAFKYILKQNIADCMASLATAAVLYIASSMETALLLSAVNVKNVFSDTWVYMAACTLTFILFIIQLFLLKTFRMFSNLPKKIRNKVFFSNFSFLAILIFIITCNMNYYTYTYSKENKWIIIANGALLLYLFYVNISINISLLRYKDLMETHVALTEELAVTRERNRFARNTHDTVGHTMTKIIILLQTCLASKEDSKKNETVIVEAIECARNGLNEIRRTVRGIDYESMVAEDIIETLEKLFSGFEASGVSIKFEVGRIKQFFNNANISNAIYRVCQEAITNSIRHGKAREISVVLNLGDIIKLLICDDGVGCKDVKKGSGLTGIEERIKELGGEVHYGSNNHKGFNIYAEIRSGNKH